jgi:hypothetical protein
MMREEVLQNLFAERDAISDMIIDIEPQNDDQRTQLQTLMQRRDRITGAINEVISAAFNEAAAGLAGLVSDLEKQTGALKQLGKTIDDVAGWIALVDEIIKLVVSILTLAGG